jgi:hypothetical protein
MLTDEQIISKYGQPGDVNQLTKILLPYPMRIAWKPETSVNSIQCHKLIATPLTNVFNELKEVYGYDALKELGIDLFGGCVNVRLMRGSKTKWSRHSWGIAIDLHPEMNQLKWKAPRAVFSGAEYKPMIDIFYKHGFISYGRERDFDWMHMEIAQ